MSYTGGDDYDVDGIEVDVNGDEVVGALQRFGRPMNLGRGQGRGGTRRVAPPRLPYNAGVARAAAIKSYMGLGAHTWAGTDAAEYQFDAEPQSTFLGKRLVIGKSESSGSDSGSAQITKPLTIAGKPQTPAPDQNAPIEMFSPEVTYASLDLMPATAGTKITIGITPNAAPGSGETFTVTVGLFGEWLA